MRAIQFTKPGHLDVIDAPEPGSPQRGEVLVQIERAGICGTDISSFLGKNPYFEFPRIPGHELGVRVLEIGKDVVGLSIGDRCSVRPYLNCGDCYSCNRGHLNCCESNQTLGVHCDGGFAERMILPADKLHPAAGLSMDQCALVETLAIGCHAVDRGTPKKTESILVVGAGPIGLSALEFARIRSDQVMLMDRVESRLQFARSKMAVSHTILAGAGDEREQLAEMSEGRLADVVIDATGNHESMARSLDLCAFKGRVVYVGITANPISWEQAPAFHRRELDIRSSRNALPENFTRIIDLIRDGRLNTDPWITHRSSLEDLPSNFEIYTRPESGVIKAMIEIA